MTAPTTLNGYAVIAAFHTPAASCTREGFVVLVDKGEDTSSPHRYVTAWAGAGDNSWNHGHYYMGKEEAQRDFTYRCNRGY